MNEEERKDIEKMRGELHMVKAMTSFQMSLISQLSFRISRIDLGEFWEMSDLHDTFRKVMLRHDA